MHLFLSVRLSYYPWESLLVFIICENLFLFTIICENLLEHNQKLINILENQRSMEVFLKYWYFGFQGRGVVIINRSAYLEKCFTLLDTSQFNKLSKDPTHTIERKIQRMMLLNDVVAMGSSLGPVLANIFMVELERWVIPTLMNKMKCWTRYVDDTLCYKKTDSVDCFEDVKWLS